MTGRGRRAPIELPPSDPTLKTRPVPRERHFVLRSFGPAASPDNQQYFHSIEDLAKKLEVSNLSEDDGEEADDTKELLELLVSECDVDWREDGTPPEDLT